MTTLLLELVAHEPFDLALDAPRFTLWRQGVEVRMSVDDGLADGVRRGLALRGVRTTVTHDQVPAPPMLVRALGTALLPARLRPDDLDVVEVRLVPLGEATTRVLRRTVRRWPLGARRRSLCRALLRGSDALLEIRRTAWCSRQSLRASRHTLRPVLFDTGAAPRALRVRASEHLLTRWIEG
ncbi:MAG TPA: hypothetical protein VIN37_10050 [Candidatus Limnocylindria bacterium]